MKRLLTHSPSQRLGSLKGGALDVKMHPWFKDFDWQAFENQTMPAPYIPKVNLQALIAFAFDVWLTCSERMSWY